MPDPFAPKQLQFAIESTAKWNLAHGSVRCGKTVGTLLAFMHKAYRCQDSQIFMVGYSSDTIYQNAIRILLESEQLDIFRPFLTWQSGKRQLKFRDKVIQTLGAKDEGSIGKFQGLTASLMYCDEMTLYPESLIDMIDTRLSNPWSQGIATMNPKQPTHKLKQWIDKAEAGDPNYYALHFTLDDNPYVDQGYKDRLKNSLSGVFYKRNYLGLWCTAEGAIFDFFDRDVYVVKEPPVAAEYWIAGIDYGMTNPTACVLIGVSTGKYSQTGRQMWVEDEYYWDQKIKGRQKLVGELADDIVSFLEPYALKNIYIDPSAEALSLELKRRGIHCTDANNDVEYGIQVMTSDVRDGKCLILDKCKNLIREIEGYTWDAKASEVGKDKPIKMFDHAIDGLRYCLASHKVAEYKPYKQQHDSNQYQNERFNVSGRRSMF